MLISVSAVEFLKNEFFCQINVTVFIIQFQNSDVVPALEELHPNTMAYILKGELEDLPTLLAILISWMNSLLRSL